MPRKRPPSTPQAETIVVVWNGASRIGDEARTKGELLPRYERKQLNMATIARIMPRKHRSAAQ